jgi:Ca2+-binding EF-hand superfamily protein
MKEKFQELGGLLSDEEIEQFHDILDSDGNGVIDVRFFIVLPESCLKSCQFQSMLSV